MKHETIHYMSICDGRYCKLKNRCKRYTLFTRNNNNNSIKLVINPDDIDLDGKCDKFWDNF